MEELGTIVGVWAHPDDETFGTGGIMASAVRAGRRVVCVTATRGEAGIQDEARWPADKLAEIRTTELENALEVLGVTEHIWLNYPDGGCAGVDGDEATARIAEIFADVEPDTVLTFGPDGMTWHPDHIAVSAWTTQAFKKVAKPGARLFYATLTTEWLEQFGPIWEKVGVMMTDDEMVVTSMEDLAFDFRLSEELIDLKYRALRMQESQIEGTLAILGEEMLRADLASEAFRPAILDD